MTTQYQKSRTINRPTLCVLLACLPIAVSGCNWVELLSASGAGEQSAGLSQNASSSANGHYVAFQSTATNLVPDDFNGVGDVFLRDTLAGITTLVSVSSAEVAGGGQSQYPSISNDGRYIAFQSGAANLVASDTNHRVDIFVRDTLGGTTTLVSADDAGAEGSNSSFNPSISGDGRYVAFWSTATNLVAGDTNGHKDIFVHDTLAGTTIRVSVDSAEMQANGSSEGPSISADGRYVVYWSDATNLVVGDTNSRRDVFMRDLLDGTTTRVSVNTVETEANHDSWEAAISADGRYVAFSSIASNLVEGDVGGTAIFVRDTLEGITTRISSGNVPSISADGRYVAFALWDIFGKIFVRDTLTGTTHQVSRDAQGLEANGSSTNPSISADGRYVVFQTDATNLVTDDLNSYTDIVIRAIPEVTVTSVNPDQLTIGATTAVTITGTNFLAGAIPYMGSAQISNYVVVDENKITANVAVPVGSTVGALDVLVCLPGTGPGPLSGVAGTCPDCVTLSPPPGC